MQRQPARSGVPGSSRIEPAAPHSLEVAGVDQQQAARAAGRQGQPPDRHPGSPRCRRPPAPRRARRHRRRSVTPTSSVGVSTAPPLPIRRSLAKEGCGGLHPHTPAPAGTDRGVGVGAGGPYGLNRQFLSAILSCTDGRVGRLRGSGYRPVPALCPWRSSRVRRSACGVWGSLPSPMEPLRDGQVGSGQPATDLRAAGRRRRVGGRGFDVQASTGAGGAG